MFAKLFVVAAATAAWIGLALAEIKEVPANTRFCPSWAEAHERSLASLNHGRPPYPVHWKGCIVVPKGTKVEVVESDDQWTEIIVKGKHWFTDEQLF
jgi:hypothetical protein